MPAQAWMRPLVIQMNPCPYALAAAIACSAPDATHASGGETSVAPAGMRRIGTIDERFNLSISKWLRLREDDSGNRIRPEMIRQISSRRHPPAVARKSDLFAKRERLRRKSVGLDFPGYVQI